MKLHLTVTQEQVTYYATPNLRDFAIGRFPTFIWQGDELAYGFPPASNRQHPSTNSSSKPSGHLVE